MLNLQILADQIENFIETSGDDVNSVIDHESSLSFSHIALTQKNFNYEVCVYQNGSIELTTQKQVRQGSALDVDVSESSTQTLTETVVVKKATVTNIQDVIEFVMSA